MKYLGWAFLGLNAFIVLSGFYITLGFTGLTNLRGKMELVFWFWQSIGIIAVLFGGWTPWHLIWWFLAGMLVSFLVGRLIVVMQWE